MPGVRCATAGEKRLIEGVKVRRLPMLPDERGVLTEILRSDDAEFASFGQAYMTTTYPAVVKPDRHGLLPVGRDQARPL